MGSREAYVRENGGIYEKERREKELDFRREGKSEGRKERETK